MNHDREMLWWVRVSTVLVVAALVAIVFTFGVFLNDIRAVQTKIQDSTDTILCVLTVLPEDRTRGGIDFCFEVTAP